MITEIRGENIKIIDNIKPERGILIGIGSERCVYKFCESMRGFLESKCETLSKYEFRLVTPRVPDKYSEIVVDYIKKMVQKFKVTSMVINDYGLLYSIKDMFDSSIEVIVGRTLMKSLEYVPWSEYMLRYEDEEVKRNLLIPNVLHKSKIEYLNKFNVIGTEICATENADKNVDRLKGMGMKVYVHYNTIIASIGRTCPVVRLNNANSGKCMKLCDKYYDVTLNKPWAGDLSPKTEEIIPPFKCVGSTVYFKSKYKNFNYENCDGVIYDNLLNCEEIEKTLNCELELKS